MRVVERMRPIAHAHGACVSQVALEWLPARETVTSVLLGATQREPLNDNLGAIEVVQSTEELGAIEGETGLAPIYPNWFSE